MGQIVIPNDIFFENLLDELGNSGQVLLNVKGCSMFPFFRDGKDSALLRPFVPAEGLKKGDVALFRFHGRFILHRCIGKRASAYIFRGDGNCKGTEWAQPENVFAVVKKRLAPAGGPSAGVSSTGVSLAGASSAGVSSTGASLAGASSAGVSSSGVSSEVSSEVSSGVSPGVSSGASSAVSSGSSSGVSSGWKEWDCDSFSWKLCSILWPRTYIVRRLLLAFLRRVYK